MLSKVGHYLFDTMEALLTNNQWKYLSSFYWFSSLFIGFTSESADSLPNLLSQSYCLCVIYFPLYFDFFYLFPFPNLTIDLNTQIYFLKQFTTEKFEFFLYLFLNDTLNHIFLDFFRNDLLTVIADFKLCLLQNCICLKQKSRDWIPFT